MNQKTRSTIFITLLILIAIVGFLLPGIMRLLSGDDEEVPTDTEKIVYSEPFTENLRQEVIRDLYGSREQYAKDATGSRADYVDKEASRGGELVIDEARMQQVYESKLAEFDAKVDMDKVNAIVEERQAKLSAENVFEDPYKDVRHLTGEQIRWKQSRKYILITDGLIFGCYFLYRIWKKKKEL